MSSRVRPGSSASTKKDASVSRMLTAGIHARFDTSSLGSMFSPKKLSKMRAKGSRFAG